MQYYIFVNLHWLLQNRLVHKSTALFVILSSVSIPTNMDISPWDVGEIGQYEWIMFYSARIIG